MRITITLYIFLLTVTSVFAQNPAMIWQNTLGGSQGDQQPIISLTNDGGYIMCGTTLSGVSGDKSQGGNGSWDYWIVKTNGTGNLEWEKTIGGSGSDRAQSIFQTEDGGYLVTGDSNSNISGDKTENSKGGGDYWILKLDTTGNIVWQQTYGGSKSDYGTIAHQTSDGGYIIAGSSNSEVSGNKTDPSYGDYDIWIIKLDVDGLIVWQKTIGGSGLDVLKSFKPTNDGGYIISVISNSPASGDKSEEIIGIDDYWIIKVDASGTVEWDKTLGGTAIDIAIDAIPTSDGGYLVGGYSNSPASGSKSENSRGEHDYWLVKLNSIGNIIWDKTIGGDEQDELTDLKELSDGSYLVSGASKSGVSGDKIDLSYGGFDNWFVNLNSSGNIIGQKTVGGGKFDFPDSVVLTEDGGFVVAATSDSNISGDKTQNSKGGYDFWIYKMESAALGIKDSFVNSSMSYYPNPTNDLFRIDLGKAYSKVTVHITDLLGKIISTSKYTSAKTIDLEIKEPTGIYLVNVDTNEGFSKSFKIVKN